MMEKENLECHIRMAEQVKQCIDCSLLLVLVTSIKPKEFEDTTVALLSTGVVFMVIIHRLATPLVLQLQHSWQKIDTS